MSVISVNWLITFIALLRSGWANKTFFSVPRSHEMKKSLFWVREIQLWLMFNFSLSRYSLECQITDQLSTFTECRKLNIYITTQNISWKCRKYGKPSWVNWVLRRLGGERKNVDVFSDNWLRKCFCISVRLNCVPTSIPWESIKGLMFP